MKERVPSLWELMGLKKSKLKARSLKPVSPIDIFESDERAIFELGSPAYRIARNRSGLGYIETQAELARFEGMLVRSVFTGQFYTAHDPFSLIALILLALFLAVIPCGLLLAGGLYDPSIPVVMLLITGAPNILFGVAALCGFVASVAKVRQGRRPG